MSTNDDYLNTSDAADEAHCHVVTIRVNLSSRTLHGIQRKPGGVWLIERECLHAWMRGTKCPHRAVTSALKLSRLAS